MPLITRNDCRRAVCRRSRFGIANFRIESENFRHHSQWSHFAFFFAKQKEGRTPQSAKHSLQNLIQNYKINAVTESQIYFNRIFNTNCPVRSRIQKVRNLQMRLPSRKFFPKNKVGNDMFSATTRFCRNEQMQGLYFHAFAHLTQKNCLKPRFLRLFSIFSLRNFPNFFKLFPLNVYFKPFLAFCPMG